MAKLGPEDETMDLHFSKLNKALLMERKYAEILCNQISKVYFLWNKEII